MLRSNIMNEQPEMTETSVNEQDMQELDFDSYIENDTDHAVDEVSETTEEPVGEGKPEEVLEDNNDSEDPFKEPEETAVEMSDESTTEEKYKDMPKGFQKQLKRNKRTVERLKRELDEARQQIQAFNTQAQPNQQAQPSQVTRNHFRTDEEYMNYMAEQRAQQYVAQIQQQQSAQAAQQKEVDDLTNSWNNKIAESYKTDEELSDYKEAISALGNPANVFRPEITKYIFDSAVGPKILKYFADRPSAINKVNSMHEFDLVNTMRDVTNYVSQSARPAAKPVTPIGGLTSNSVGHAQRSIDEMSDDEKLELYASGKLKF